MARRSRLPPPPRTEMIFVDYIDVADRHRQPTHAAIERLAASMREIGLRTPITVRYFEDRPSSRGTDDSYVLVAGAHRLAAARLLGWKQIECFEALESDVDAELWEIDENLCRAELTDVEESDALIRRQEVYERLHPETKNGAIGNGRKKVRQIGEATPESADRFTKETAKKTGKSERVIQRALHRGKAIGADLPKLAGTSLDKGVELDALAGMPAEKRTPLIERAIAGEKVSARDAGGGSLDGSDQQQKPRTAREAKRFEAFLVSLSVIQGIGDACRLLKVPDLAPDEADGIVKDLTEVAREMKKLETRIRAAAVGGKADVVGADDRAPSTAQVNELA